MIRIDSLQDATPDARRVSADLSQKTTDLLTSVHKFLIASGWKRISDRRLSAMFEKAYERDQRQLVLSGWHGGGKPGTNRNYGDLKLLFGIGDNQPYGKGPREPYAKEFLSLDIVNGTVDDANHFLIRAKTYILEGR